MVERVPRLKKTDNGAAENVGYRKPPKHAQFKPGQSGNPKGRPKGKKNFKTEVLEKLKSTVKVNQGGRVTKITTQRAGLEVLAAKALGGDQRAIEQLVRLAEKYDQPLPEAADSVGLTDQAIIDAYIRRSP